jgi:trehalose-6-phosphate synthase
MNLQGNSFGLEGAESLAHALENNFSLRNLGFDSSKFSHLLRHNRRYHEHLLQVEKHGHDYHLGLLPLVLSKAWIPLHVHFGLIQKHPVIFQ